MNDWTYLILSRLERTIFLDLSDLFFKRDLFLAYLVQSDFFLWPSSIVLLTKLLVQKKIRNLI